MKKYIIGGIAIIIIAAFFVLKSNADVKPFYRFADSPVVYQTNNDHAIADPAEFFSLGGMPDWSNVEVIASFGSVSVNSEYKYKYVNSASSNTQTIKTTPEDMGSVVITGAGTGTFTLYNATTSDVTKRAVATSSLDVIAQFPASTAAGTYTFDVDFNYGLIATYVGTIATEYNNLSLMGYSRGMNPNSRNGYKKGHPDFVSKESRKIAGPKIAATLKKIGHKPPAPYHGKKMPLWVRNKISFSRGGTGIENRKKYRHPNGSPEYKEYRSAIFQRDNWTCQTCGKRSEVGSPLYLEIHHIKSWAHYLDLRFNMNNGVTLCRECHKMTDNYKGKAAIRF